MHAIEARNIVVKFNQALESNDVVAAVTALKSVKIHHFQTFADLRYLPVAYAQYVDNIAASHKHSVDIDILVKCAAKKFPSSYIVMFAELVYRSQVVFDNAYAYSVLRNMEQTYPKEIEVSFCNRACTICIALKRFEEAQDWIARGRSLIKPEHHTLAATSFNILEANVLQRIGKHREAIERAHAEIECDNQECCFYVLARSHFLLHEYSLAESYILRAIELQPDAQNYLQYAQILFAAQRYVDCLTTAKLTQVLIEEEWGSRHHFNEFEQHLHTEAFKILIKAAIKLGRTDEAKVHLESAKKVIVYQECWQDIEDLWPEMNDTFAQCLQKYTREYTKAYPCVSHKAIFFIARADAITECLADLESWYDAICRDRGLAFEIILREIVCKGENTMDLVNMIGYVSGKPGDLLYGSKMLHVLRNIRNRNSHDPIPTAEDANNSRRILFEEVLAKL